MRTIVVIAILAVVSASANSVAARDIVDIACELSSKEMKPAEWNQYVKSANAKFQTWISDNPDGNIKRYLDDKLIEIAPAVIGGNVKALKKMTLWTALYREFNEPAPEYLQEIATKYQKDLDEVLVDFTWEKAAERIKNRGKDLEKDKARIDASRQKK
jgi:hypothetical protein